MTDFIPENMNLIEAFNLGYAYYENLKVIKYAGNPYKHFTSERFQWDRGILQAYIDRPLWK